MAIDINSLRDALNLAFPESLITVVDLVGDGEHYSIEIISGTFKNQTKVAQHKLVYAVLKNFDIHALQIKTSCMT